MSNQIIQIKDGSDNVLPRGTLPLNTNANNVDVLDGTQNYSYTATTPCMAYLRLDITNDNGLAILINNMMVNYISRTTIGFANTVCCPSYYLNVGDTLSLAFEGTQHGNCLVSIVT